jgi:protein-disulfide isomerase
MTKRLWAAAVLASLVFVAGLTAQRPAPPVAGVTLDTPGLELYFRHLLMWPASVEVTIGNPTPAPLPGFYKVKVRGTLGGKSQENEFYVSADSKTVIRGDIFDVGKSPFQDDIDNLKTNDQPFLGVPGAPVTVVEFADFQCPYCKQEAGVIRTQLMEAFPSGIQLYYMDYPLDAIHPFARGAAILGRCIYTQNNGSFWAYHDWIFEHQADITATNLRDKVIEYAKTDKNLDAAKLTSCALSQQPRDEVDRTVAIGDALHINATPTVYINGRRLVGTIALDDLKMVVEHEIAWAKTQKKAVDCCSVQLALPGMGPVAAPVGGKAAPQ